MRYSQFIYVQENTNYFSVYIKKRYFTLCWVNKISLYFKVFTNNNNNNKKNRFQITVSDK